MSEDYVGSGQHQRVQEVLLAYLLAADALRWPGTDCLTLDEVLHSYPLAARDGLVPDLPTLRQHHPELADILNDLFAV